MNYEYHTVEEALEELRAGKIILVTDDPDRENEGDMICAGEFATQDNINFMATHAKGLICTPMSADLAAKLGFPQMVSVLQLQQCRNIRFRFPSFPIQRWRPH